MHRETCQTFHRLAIDGHHRIPLLDPCRLPRPTIHDLRVSSEVLYPGGKRLTL